MFFHLFFHFLSLLSPLFYHLSFITSYLCYCICFRIMCFRSYKTAIFLFFKIPFFSAIIRTYIPEYISNFSFITISSNYDYIMISCRIIYIDIFDIFFAIFYCSFFKCPVKCMFRSFRNNFKFFNNFYTS